MLGSLSLAFTVDGVNNVCFGLNRRLVECYCLEKIYIKLRRWGPSFFSALFKTDTAGGGTLQLGNCGDGLKRKMHGLLPGYDRCPFVCDARMRQVGRVLRLRWRRIKCFSSGGAGERKKRFDHTPIGIKMEARIERLDLSGTLMGKKLAYCRNRFLKRRSWLWELYDLSNMYWRVRHPDGDWEELRLIVIKSNKERNWRLQLELDFQD